MRVFGLLSKDTEQQKEKARIKIEKLDNKIIKCAEKKESVKLWLEAKLKS